MKEAGANLGLCTTLGAHRTAVISVSALVVCCTLLAFATIKPGAVYSEQLRLPQARQQWHSNESPKYLVYTTIGSDAAYIRCVKWLLLSLDHFSPKASFHFLVITDAGSKRVADAILPRRQLRFPLDYLVLEPAVVDKPDEDPAVAASSRKLDIYRYPGLDKFDNIMYLDADYLVTFDITEVLAAPLKPGVLYAHHETRYMMSTPPKDYPKLHRKQWWSFQNYTTGEIEFFRKNKVVPFSAGCFMFKNTPQFLQAFKNIKSAMMTFTGKYFYEQSFLNYYFNTRLLADTQLLSPYLLEYWTVANAAGTYTFDKKLFHMVHAGVPPDMGKKKEAVMKQYFKTEVLEKRHKQVEILKPWLHTLTLLALEALPSTQRSGWFNRGKTSAWFRNMGHIGQVHREVDRYYALALDPNVNTICEIGFNAGHSTAVFLAAKPRASIYTFDMLTMPYSKTAVTHFKNLYPSNFHFVQGSSFDTVPWLHMSRPDIKCDLFSVDGDHSFEGGITDLINAIAMMPLNSTLVADDVSDHFPGFKQAWLELQKAGYLTNIKCEEPGPYDVGGSSIQYKRWCWGHVAKPRYRLLARHASKPGQLLHLDTMQPPTAQALANL